MRSPSWKTINGAQQGEEFQSDKPGRGVPRNKERRDLYRPGEQFTHFLLKGTKLTTNDLHVAHPMMFRDIHVRVCLHQ
jgi:hypothetical protein